MKNLTTELLIIWCISIAAVYCCCSIPGLNPYQEGEICGLIPLTEFNEPKFVIESCEQDFARTGIPCATREAIMISAMQQTIVANSNSPCPSSPYGAIIGIHHGPNVADFEQLCFGCNNATFFGPTAHGEMQSLRACALFVYNSPKYGPSYVKNYTFWQTTSLYTTGESCPMCMSAQRFTRIGEVIYATSIKQLMLDNNTGQITLDNPAVQQHSNVCGSFGTDGTAFQTRVVAGVATSYTNIFFNWQFNTSGACPPGCSRPATPLGAKCLPISPPVKRSDASF